MRATGNRTIPAETSSTILQLEEDSGWEELLLGFISLRGRGFRKGFYPPEARLNFAGFGSFST